MHPEASQDKCTKVAAAHTLQRSRVLRVVGSDENHIGTFYPFTPIDEGDIKVHSRGWKKASVFNAFCSYHDDSTFGALEKSPFIGSKEQIFLIAYRAVCWEVFQKERAIRMKETLSELIDRGADRTAQQYVQRALHIQDAGMRKGLRDAARLKDRMDTCLLSGDLSLFEAVRIQITGKPTVVATGAITPNRTVQGNALQTLHDPTVKIAWLPFGIDVHEPECSVVFMHEADADPPRQYLEPLLGSSSMWLEAFLPQFFFAHCENAYFSLNWWETLPDADQRFVRKLAANGNPYYEPPKYDTSTRLIDWSLKCIERL